MESRELIAFLAQATLVGSAAIVLVLLARQPLRRAFGAQAAYAAWWLVPAVLLASALPSAPPGDVVGIGVRLAAPMRAAASFAGREAGFAWQPWVTGAWAVGAIAFALLMASAQAKFRARLGALRPLGEAWRAEHAAEGLPATVGVLAPRIVVPADFESRYDARQRELVLAHERAHIARGDASANLAAAAMRCLCWFNPLVHAAARCFRQDQELACDAIVVARHPQLRRAYGDALFQAQLIAEASPLACHFGFGHPLRERIAMLREPIATRRRRIAGNAAAAILVSIAAFAAWAAQPPVADSQDARALAGDTVHTMQSSAHLDQVHSPPPAYPKETRRAGSVGKVVLLVDVAADGSVAGVKVESPSPDSRLDAAAAEAAWKWRFTPGVENGKPIASQVRVPVEFSQPPVDFSKFSVEFSQPG